MPRGENQPKAGPITSEYASDPDMSELVDLFVTELPARLAAIRSAHDAGNGGAFARLVHQLKSAGSGYGFPGIAERAAAVEDGLRSGGLASVQRQVSELLELCARASTGR
ncbi:MAG: Hpt domain-containing protein [Phycisphaerales bacterium]|nr:Hpt domain-containing protein [Phycisphaerales bacterium]